MSGDGERRQRAVMATDEEWERIGRAAAANGMDRSRFVVHRALTRHTISGSTTPSGSSFGPATGSAGPATASRPGLASGIRVMTGLQALPSAAARPVHLLAVQRRARDGLQVLSSEPRGRPSADRHARPARIARGLRPSRRRVPSFAVHRGRQRAVVGHSAFPRLGPATGLSLHVMSAAPCGPTTRPTLPASPRKTPGATPAAYSPLSQSSALPPQSCNSALRLGVLRPCQRRVLSSFHERLPH